jgi:predicted Rossmann fold nucleotide-binding protein DprA/Smf involved in DNA uptake
MKVKNREDARQRTEILVELRKQHAEGARRAQQLFKAQQSVRKMLERAMQDAPQSVPQLAERTGIPAHEVLWHIAAMKKYGSVEETGIDESGDYYLYGLSKETEA